eukprot:scaffold201790_cov65-Attheya_sp.AAC.1
MTITLNCVGSRWYPPRNWYCATQFLHGKSLTRGNNQRFDLLWMRLYLLFFSLIGSFLQVDMRCRTFCTMTFQGWKNWLPSSRSELIAALIACDGHAIQVLVVWLKYRTVKETHDEATAWFWFASWPVMWEMMD